MTTHKNEHYAAPACHFRLSSSRESCVVPFHGFVSEAESLGGF